MIRFRHDDGRLPNSLALSYALLGWIGGLFLISRQDAGTNLLGVLLLGHAMTIAAYLVHECAHNTILASNDANARLGKGLLWICGGCYARYEDIRHKHFRHHVDRADVVSFDYRPKLARWPRLLKVLEALEWAWIPAFDFLWHALIIVLPFVWSPRKDRRRHVLTVLVIRTLLFGLLAWYAPRVLVLYPIAYALMLHILRFMDAFQHTYELQENLDQPRSGPVAFDADYEHRNTYTNLHSSAHPWLNLLTLNFGYHNVHHDRPTQPWYRLPALQKELYGEGEDPTGQGLPFANQWRAYRQHRISRLLTTDPADAGVSNASFQERGKNFIGVDGVSFLVTQ